MTRVEWNTEEATIKTSLPLGIGPKATQQITRSKYRTDPGNIKTLKYRKKKQNIQQILPTEKKQIQLTKSFLVQTNKYGNTGRSLEEINRIRRGMPFSRFQHRITCVEIYNINH